MLRRALLRGGRQASTDMPSICQESPRHFCHANMVEYFPYILLIRTGLWFALLFEIEMYLPCSKANVHESVRL